MTAWPMLVVLALFFLGVPCSFAMMIVCIPYFLSDQYIQATVVAQKLLASCESQSLMAIPFFITAGAIMNYSGISEKLMEFADGLVGHLTGGLGHVNVLISTLMGGVSGSGAADCAMECKILVPEMLKYGYSKPYSAAITAATAVITPIIPPGINLILFACLCECSVGRLLASGYLPGLLLCVAFMVTNHIISKKRGYVGGRKRMMEGRKLFKLFLSSLWALFLPFGLIMLLRFGVCTATEGGVMMAFYSIFVGKFVYKKLDFKRMPQILLEAVNSTAPVMMILCAANLFSYYMSWENVPSTLTNALLNLTSNKYVFLILCNILFLVIGCFMDAMAAMIVIAPLLAPVVRALGIDIIHFGLVMCFNCGLAAITPPFGTYIFLVSGILKMKTGDMIRDLWPFIGIAVIVLLLVTYVPWFSTFIPNLMYGTL
ncbi:MAG: TRAP transporter large permease [Candidatus Limivicinus sp.]|nr:TRAP transporter large permease [Candidatus Limivicinus sp.]